MWQRGGSVAGRDNDQLCVRRVHDVKVKSSMARSPQWRFYHHSCGVNYQLLAVITILNTTWRRAVFSSAVRKHNNFQTRKSVQHRMMRIRILYTLGTGNN